MVYHKIRKLRGEAVGIFGLIIFGGIVGWLASLLMHTDQQQGIIANIIVGILGSMIGGFVMRLFDSEGVTGFNFRSVVIGVLGAVILLAIVRAFSSRGAHHA